MTINAKVGDTAETSDSVAHYGKAGKLVVESMYTASYHEYGTVAFAEIQKGRVVAEEGGHIEVAIVNATADVAFAQENGGTIGVAYATSEANKTANNNDASKKELTYLAEADTVAEVEEKGNEYINECLDAEAKENNADAVVRIGTKGYAKVNEALSAAQDGDTVVLLGNDNCSSASVAQNKKVTLDLNGYTFTLTNSLTINVGAVLTIKDTSSSGDGEIISTNSSKPAIKCYSGSNLIVESGKIQGYQAIYVDSTDQDTILNVTIKGGIINGTNVGIYVPGTSGNVGTRNVTIEGGTISSMTLKTPYNATISGGTFNGNVSYTLDGLDKESSTPWKISGGDFTNATLNVTSDYPLTITGGTFASNPSEKSNVTIGSGYHWDSTTNSVVSDN